MRATFLALPAVLLAPLMGCESISLRAERTPVWAGQPTSAEQSGRFISAQGEAAPGSEGPATLQDAERAARAELARYVAAYVRDAFREFLQSHPDYADAA